MNLAWLVIEAAAFITAAVIAIDAARHLAQAVRQGWLNAAAIIDDDEWLAAHLPTVAELEQMERLACTGELAAITDMTEFEKDFR